MVGSTLSCIVLQVDSKKGLVLTEIAPGLSTDDVKVSNDLHQCL